MFIGETKLGIPLEPEGFVAVCRSGPTSSGTLLYELDRLGDSAPLPGEEDEAEALDEDEAGGDEAGGTAGKDEDEDEDETVYLDEDDGPIGDTLMEDPEEAEALELEAAGQDMLTAAVLGPPGLTEDAEGISRPRRVWVLMGGDDGQQATASLRSGLEVVRRLGQFSDMQVRVRERIRQHI